MVKNKRLSKSISDVAWSEFMRQLEYKATWKGKTITKIDKWFPSSQICSNCGSSTGKKPLHVRKFVCLECNTSHDRDIIPFIFQNMDNRKIPHLLASYSLSLSIFFQK